MLLIIAVNYIIPFFNAMNLTEAYLFLLTDSFISGLILPAKHSLVLPAMRIFGGYNYYLSGLLYSIGITAGAILNWVLGKLLRSVNKNLSVQQSLDSPNNMVEKIIPILKKYGYWGGIAGFIPVLGPFITVLAGLAQTSFKKTIILVFIVNLLIYCA